MNSIKYLVLVFCLCSLSCNKNTRNNNHRNDTIDEVLGSRSDMLTKQKRELIKKKLEVLDQVIGDSLRPEGQVVFLYNGFDCSTCIEEGFKLVKEIDSLANKKVCYIISTSANIGSDQLKYEYKEFIFNDENDLIRSSLKYIFTPVLLLINSSSYIEDVYYPSYEINQIDRSTFVNRSLQVWKNFIPE